VVVSCVRLTPVVCARLSEVVKLPARRGIVAVSVVRPETQQVVWARVEARSAER
jgi:hypothetical protein